MSTVNTYEPVAEFDEFDDNNRLDITSKCNIHACSVYEYIQDLPFELPVEVIATISKFYLSQANTDPAANVEIRRAMNAEIERSIPSSCSFSNPIPTGEPTKKSVLTGQFLLELVVYAALMLTLLGVYLIVNVGSLALYLIIGAVMGFAVAYILYLCLYQPWRIIERVIATPISDADDRTLSLNSIFGAAPFINFYIRGSHESSSSSTTSTVVTFRKEQSLDITHCESVITPNIYNDNALYPRCCYHFEFDILLRFESDVDEARYQKRCRHFILNNIHDKSQQFGVRLKYGMVGFNHWFVGGDTNGFIIVVNGKRWHHIIWVIVLKCLMAVCTALCISWVYKVPFYMFIKRKRLTITKYLSFGRLRNT